MPRVTPSKALSTAPARPTTSSSVSQQRIDMVTEGCLGGNARTVILANISPSEASYNETMSTLRYVERAKLIVNTVRVNETSTDPVFVAHLQKTIVHLQEKVITLSKAQNLKTLR